jgi:hypothetical protein
VPPSASGCATARSAIPSASCGQTDNKHKRHQEGQRRALGVAWPEYGLVFTAATGNPINPNNRTRDFKSTTMSCQSSAARP